MALQTGSDLADWESIFTNVGITTASAKIYAQTFTSEGITRDTMHMLDWTMLKELGIKSMGEVLIILKLAKENPASPTTHVKPTAKPPQLNSEMTPQQFRKFKIDWDVFTKMTNLSDTQMNVQLYNCAEETVQNSIINTYPEFFNVDPSKLLDMLEVLVTMKSNPIVHRISFSSIAQGDSTEVRSKGLQLYMPQLWPWFIRHIRQQKHRRSRFPGQWQGRSSHLAVQKYPNSRYWPITGTTTTSPPAPWFHSFATIPLQTTSWMDSSSATPRRNSS